MGRPRKSEEEKLINLGVMVAPSVGAEISALSIREDMTRSALSRDLLILGLTVYKSLELLGFGISFPGLAAIPNTLASGEVSPLSGITQEKAS